MKPVKRGKLVQKKIVYLITDLFQFCEHDLLSGISLLWLLANYVFGGIFIHRSCKIIRITHWHIPCDFTVTRALEEY
jgi:hypothetical protein